MVQPLEQGLKPPADLGKIHYPSGVRIHLPPDVDPDPEGMAVEPSALVALWQIWQKMRRFDGKLLEDLHHSQEAAC